MEDNSELDLFDAYKEWKDKLFHLIEWVWSPMKKDKDILVWRYG